jgi:hypothetical protein
VLDVLDFGQGKRRSLRSGNKWFIVSRQTGRQVGKFSFTQAVRSSSHERDADMNPWDR